MSKVVLENKDLKFIPISDEYTELIVSWRNNDRVFNNFIFSERMTEEMHRNWLRNKVETGQVIQFIVIEKDTDIPIGSVYFRDVDNTKKEAEYGVFIGEDSAVGKGYGNQIAQLALEYIFEKKEFKKIKLRVLADNVVAIKSYKKAGFEKQEYIKNYINKNGWRDLIIMVIEKDRWKRHKEEA